MGAAERLAERLAQRRAERLEPSRSTRFRKARGREARREGGRICRRRCDPGLRRPPPRLRVWVTIGHRRVGGWWASRRVFTAPGPQAWCSSFCAESWSTYQHVVFWALGPNGWAAWVWGSMWFFFF